MNIWYFLGPWNFLFPIRAQRPVPIALIEQRTRRPAATVERTRVLGVSQPALPRGDRRARTRLMGYAQRSDAGSALRRCRPVDAVGSSWPLYRGGDASGRLSETGPLHALERHVYYTPTTGLRPHPWPRGGHSRRLRGRSARRLSRASHPPCPSTARRTGAHLLLVREHLAHEQIAHAHRLLPLGALAFDDRVFLETDPVPSSQTTERIRLLEAFATLIANTDRHFGNIRRVDVYQDPFELAPVYDRLPMLFAPRHDQLIDRDCESLLPTAASLAVWAKASALAEEHWAALACDERLSEPFRALRARCQITLRAHTIRGT